MFSLNAILAILVLSFSVFLAFLVLFKNIKSKKNILFFLFSLSVSSWMLCSVLSDLVKDPVIALWLARSAMAGIPLFLGFLFLFVLIFPKEEKKISSWVKFLVFLPVLVIEIFVPTKYNIEKIEVHEWGIEYEPGIIFWPLFAMILIFVALSCFILIKKYRKSQGIVRERIKYFLLALILSVVIGVGGNFFLPLWGYSRFSVWGPILAITVFNSVIAYSILRYRLMEVCLVVQKGLAYFVSFSILLFLYLG